MMSADDREFRQHIEAKAAHMHAAAMYRRLRSVVDGWAREERMRRRVAGLTFAGLGLVAAAALAAVLIMRVIR
jgi:hypothetical protein